MQHIKSDIFSEIQYKSSLNEFEHYLYFIQTCVLLF